MKPISHILIGLVVLALIPYGTTQAQLGEAPLVILMQGDLHAWDNGQLFRLTNNGYNNGPVMSPQGRYVAYNAVSPAGISVLESGFVGDALFPNDIFIYDLQTNGITPAALQPANVRFMSSSGSDNFIARSQPAWSGDGASLAWTEMTMPDFTHRLVRYDVDTGATTGLDVLPQPGAIPAPAQVQWVGPNIVVQTYLLNEATGAFQDTFMAYSASGSQLSDIRLNFAGASLMNAVEVVEGTAGLGLQFADSPWELMDPLQGDRQTLAEPPELYSQHTPDSSVTLRSTAGSDPQQGLTYTWDLLSASRQTTQRLPYTGWPDGITIAPDGQRVAYVGDDAVYIWTDHAQRIPGTEVVASDFSTAVVWGATGWRTPSFSASVVVPTIPAAVNSGDCPGFMPSRLEAGGQGRVMANNDIPNNVRNGPGTSNVRSGQIPAGEIFQVLSGPVCADNTAWWQVQYRSLTGWTAEGQGGDYWLEPYNTPTPGAQAQSYIVQRGDILARIAQQFDVSVNCITQTNNLANPNRLIPGQVLIIDPSVCD